MENLIRQYKNNIISQRSFISKIKSNIKYTKELCDKTSFLDEYNPDILERIYYIINEILEPVKCKYCNNKAKWSGRLNEGYKLTCCSKECESKRISEQKSNNNIISENRNNKFIEQQNNITEVTDDVIKDLIRYDNQIELITNNKIIEYLKNRFNNSDSLIESFKRIKLGIEEKPKCPVCGKPVTFIGKNSKMFTIMLIKRY